MAKTRSNKSSGGKTRSNKSNGGVMSSKTRSVLKKIENIARRNNQPIGLTSKDKLKKNAKTVGTVRQVATGFAKKTEGGLLQKDILTFKRNGKRSFVSRKAHLRSKKNFGNMNKKMSLRMPFYIRNGQLIKPAMTYGQFIKAGDDNSTKAQIISHYLK